MEKNQRIASGPSGERSRVQRDSLPNWSSQLESRMIAAILFLFGFAVTLGQLIPGDSVAVVAGSTLWQIAIWIVLSVVAAIAGLAFRGRSLPVPTWLVAVGLGMIAWMAVSTWFVQGRGNLRFAINVFWQWVAAFAVVYLSWWLVQRMRSRETLALLFVGLGIACSIHAMYQYAYSMPRDRLRYQQEPEVVLQELGLDAPPGSASRMRWEDRLQSTEPIGPFALTNSLAGFLAPCSILLMAILAETSRKRWRDWRWLLSFIALVLMLVVLGLTKSRTAWIATACAVAVYCAMHPAVRDYGRRHWKLGISLIGLLLAGAAMWIIWVDERILSEAPKSLAFRWQYWQSTLVLIQKHWMFGVGPGNFQDHYATYKLANSSEVVFDPHSFLLETIATGGLAAGLLLSVILIGILLLGWRQCWENPSRLEDANTTGPRSKAVRLGIDSQTMALLLGAGIALGTMLVIPGLLGPSPELTSYLVGIPLVALWLAVLVQVFADQSISQRAYLCALIAGFVHLSASGGWLAPGVTNVLAMIAAMILAWQSRTDRTTSVPFNPRTALSYRVGALVSVVVAIGCLFAFSRTSWQPIQRAAAVQSQMAISYEQAERNVRQAIAYDPWNPAYRAGLLGLLFVELGQNAQKRALTSVEIDELKKAAEELIASDPHSWRVHFEIGRQAMMHAARAPQLGDMALQHFRRAAELSPQDAAVHLQVALVGWLVEDRQNASSELEKALEIDRSTPHLDQKLSTLLVWWPSDFAPRSNADSQLEWKPVGRDSSIGMGWVRAEPLVDFLRTQLD